MNKPWSRLEWIQFSHLFANISHHQSSLNRTTANNVTYSNKRTDRMYLRRLCYDCGYDVVLQHVPVCWGQSGGTSAYWQTSCLDGDETCCFDCNQLTVSLQFDKDRRQTLQERVADWLIAHVCLGVASQPGHAKLTSGGWDCWERQRRFVVLLFLVCSEADFHLFPCFL